MSLVCSLHLILKNSTQAPPLAPPAPHVEEVPPAPPIMEPVLPSLPTTVEEVHPPPPVVDIKQGEDAPVKKKKPKKASTEVYS